MTGEPPACAACVHLLGKREATDYYQGWLCNHPENIASQTRNLVTGLVETQYVKMNCVEARTDFSACGPAGRGFELYVKPEYHPPGGGKTTKSADELLKELEI